MTEAVRDSLGSEADIGRIMQLIPHRYPFLLIDRVVQMQADKGAVGIKNVGINEPYFQGHFPGSPVMPGVLIVEAMAQTAAVLVVHTLGPAWEGKLVYFMSIDNCRFRRPVYPGDQLRIEVVKERSRGPVWKFQGTAKVDDKLVAQAVFAAMIRENT
jgi:3-hydroxyacyl-[acyl-carrier-protein] dehydratase